MCSNNLTFFAGTPLRHAVICALDLGHNPTTLDSNLLFIEIRQKFNHSDLPPKSQYEPVSGFTLTMAEMPGIILFHPLLTQMLQGKLGGDPLLDSLKEANTHMKKKGCLRIAAVLLQAHNIVDMVKIASPSPAAARHVQEADNWGEEWAC